MFFGDAHFICRYRYCAVMFKETRVQRTTTIWEDKLIESGHDGSCHRGGQHRVDASPRLLRLCSVAATSSWAVLVQSQRSEDTRLRKR